MFEQKWDGARLLARVCDGGAELYSRNGNKLTSFPEVCGALGPALRSRSAILDGEIVAVDRHGRPSFQRLQRRRHVARPAAALRTAIPVTFMVFDVLFLDGAEVTRRPYVDRRKLLEDLGLAGPRILMPPCWADIDADVMLEVCREFVSEGVVAKRATSTYQPGRRSPAWIKHPLRSTANVVLGGWIPSRARTDAVGSLLVGAHDYAGQLVYCGHVGSGFTERARRKLATLLTEISCATPPFAGTAPESIVGLARWVTPVLAGQVQYREFTGRRLRHASWKGLPRVDPRLVRLPGIPT